MMMNMNMIMILNNAPTAGGEGLHKVSRRIKRIKTIKRIKNSSRGGELGSRHSNPVRLVAMRPAKDNKRSASLQ